MEIENSFFTQVLNNMPDHIVVIDLEGNIVFSNQAWDTFGEDNGVPEDQSWKQHNYLDVCDQAANSGDDFGTQAAKGIRKIINDGINDFSFEYPCHSPTEKRWFMMTAKLMSHDDKPLILISHINITERKLAEESALNQSREDHLTKIANRRNFDEFAEQLWAANRRNKQEVCLAIIDLDRFKEINDEYGHQAGDNALIEVAKLLSEISQRPTELCARFGGDEFVVIYGDSSKLEVYKLLSNFQKQLENRKIPAPDDKGHQQILTTSIGLYAMQPTRSNRFSFLYEAADRLLYCAKNKGRNTIVTD